MKEEQLSSLLTYIGQMLWLISSQLHTLLGGGDYPVPDVTAVADIPPSWPEKGDLLTRLKGDKP